MLAVFPTMFLSLFAHLLLRIFLGGIFLYLAYRHLFRDRMSLQAIIHLSWPTLAWFGVRCFGIVELLLGVLFIVGAYTQITALISIAHALKILILHRRLSHPSVPQRLFYVLLIGASLSLLITGAGAFAYDLPL